METEISGLTFWLQFGFLKTETKPNFGFCTSLVITSYLLKLKLLSDNVNTNLGFVVFNEFVDTLNFGGCHLRRQTRLIIAINVI